MKAPTQNRQDWIRGRRQKRQFARKTRLRRQLLRFTLLLALIFTGASGFIYLPWVISDPSRQIAVHGNHVTADSQVRSMLTSALGQPLFRLDPKVLEHLVCRLPTVRYAFVRRHVLPKAGLDVQVLEEFPWASLCHDPAGEPSAVISESGRIIPVNEFPEVIKPQLKFCGASDFQMSAAQVAHWDVVVRLIGEQIGQPVSLVDLRQPAKIAVYCGGLELHLGQDDSGLLQRLKRLDSILPAALALKDKLKYVDLSLDSNIPLKVDRAAVATTKDSELLHEAAKALAANR